MDGGQQRSHSLLQQPCAPNTKKKTTQTTAERERQREMDRQTVYLVEANDVRMLQQLHDLHLSEDLLQVLVIQLGLIHNLYSHLERGDRGERVKTSEKQLVRVHQGQSRAGFWDQSSPLGSSALGRLLLCPKPSAYK